MTGNCDICIVGGGVAGAALAAYLGKGKLRVVVIEKSLAEQDRIVGELLQPGGVQMLEKMGLAHVLEGYDAQAVEGYALFMGNRHFKVAYPEQAGGKVCTGRGLRNGKLLQALRVAMQANPCVTVIEGTVNRLTETNGTVTGVSYTPKGACGETTINAALTVVSDGIFSNFRQGLTAAPKKVNGHFLGMVLKNCQLPYPGHGHVVVAQPAPVLVYPISSTETRMLIDFPGETAPRKGEELDAYLRQTIGPQLPPSIQPSFYAAVTEARFKVMPNHLLPAHPVLKPGVVLLGDSLNMRHPLTGGGMTVAFTDVHHLGNQLLQVSNFANPKQVSKAVNNFYQTRNSQTATINILADALYAVMRNPDLKQACFDYLKQGGNYSAGPVSILSAVSRDVKLLIAHFFAVALFGVKNLLLPLPTPAKVGRSYRLLAGAVKIITPLLRNERLVGVPRVVASFFA